jgi:hypothetical protein
MGETDPPRDAISERRNIADGVARLQPARDTVQRFIDGRFRVQHLMPAEELQQRPPQMFVFFAGRNGVRVETGQQSGERPTCELPSWNDTGG